MVIAAAAPSISLGHSQCHFCHAEGISCSTSGGINNTLVKPPFDYQRVSNRPGIRFRCECPFLGSMTQFQWLPLRREICLTKVSVAADYSDSVPNSSNYVSKNGYHPLEDLKDQKRIRDTKLTYAEIARTTVEANSSALLIFPGTVHCEPHDHISWADCQYIVDDYGDIFFEIFDDENILEDRRASNPVNVVIGMDISPIDNTRVSAAEYNVLEDGSIDDILFNDDYLEGFEISDVQDWGMPDTSDGVHPVYFAKCLTKAVHSEYAKKMEHPSNGVSFLGCLRPTFVDEELYLRRLFNGEDSDGYISDCKDGEILSFGFKSDGSQTSSTIYRLEILRIELFSVYGVQPEVSLQDFQDAEPDILVHSSQAIVERYCEEGMRTNFALRALCKKKGIHVEGVNLIGVDSLGIDVRVFSGVEARTHRFPFKVRTTSESAAEKQIQQLLFPRSHRKKFRSRVDGLQDTDLL